MRLSPRFLSPLMNVIGKKLDFYCQYTPSSLSIQQLLDFGRNGDQKSSYLFLRKELCVRLANIMKEISFLPPQLLQQPSCKLVLDLYQQSFSDFQKFDDVPPDPDGLHDFNETIQSVLVRHSHIVETMAEGLIELNQTNGIDVWGKRNMEYFLDRFYMNRISIRMLMNQHILVFGSNLPESPRHVGAIDPACDVVGVVQDAYENARFLCDRYYLTAPDIKIETHNSVDGSQSEITIVAVPSHLYHVMFELLKNAMRAVVEHHGPEDDHLPDLKVFVTKGNNDLAIKICDRGGGMPCSAVNDLFEYMYTTAPPPDREGRDAPLAGYGYGLPLSRLYARYFQGDIFLIPMEGYGTDACVYMRAMAPAAKELLPIYSTLAKRQLTMATQASDWSSPFPSGSINSHRSFSSMR